MAQAVSLDAADAYCRGLVRHYENFTVASRLSPRSLRRDLTRVYAFCRYTDDLGDESGDRAVAMRRLRRWRDETRESFDHDERTHPVLVALADTVRRFGLEAQPFVDLIDANLQDQRIDMYDDWPALRAYCMLSAAPVGRIVLRLSDIHDPAAVPLSDDVCIGLQLANFAQDVSVDKRLGRTYLLQSDIRSHGIDGATRSMCERARALLESGVTLEAMAPPRLRMQLALYRLGGIAILDAIAAAGYRTAAHRPKVDRIARVRLATIALTATTATSVRRYSATRTRLEGGGGRSANLGASDERENMSARRASGQAEHIVRLPPRAAPHSAVEVPAQPARGVRLPPRAAPHSAVGVPAGDHNA
jgi:squalene synthase HpnC